VPITPPLSRGEKAALLSLVATLAAWPLLCPILSLVAKLVGWPLLCPIVQPLAYHAFADRRAFQGIPSAADVLSNLAFVAVGLLGLLRLHGRAEPSLPVPRASLEVFFVGVVLIGFGSAYYHLHPTDRTLVWDRLAMTVAFAGVYGATLTQRVSRRAGLAVLLAMLVLGPASVLFWAETGDLSLYVLVQAGLGVGLPVLLLLTPRGDDPFPWWALVLWYAVAKAAELGDALIWRATHELFGGHVIKHLAAAMGALAIANALRSKPVADG
jgi:hypothetical protein